MSAPQHLWSGDWEQDSASHAEALARRNVQRAEEPPPEEDARPGLRFESRTVASVPVAPARTFGERFASFAAVLWRVLLAILRWIGLIVLALAGGLRFLVRGAWRLITRADRARLRLVAAAALLIAVVAVAAVAVFGSGGSGPSNANASPAAIASIQRWLGVQLTDVPNRGVVFETITPNGLAAAEGFEPGDTLAQIDNHAINGYGDIVKVFSTVKPADQIAITVNRGSSVYTASFPMPPRPSGGP
jgi:hypothetical protein